MTEDSLEKIKEAENRAAKLIEDANEKKIKIIAEARKEALDIINEVEVRAEKDRERLLEKLKKELIEDTKNKTEETEFRIRKLKADVSTKISKEADFLLEKFLEGIR